VHRLNQSKGVRGSVPVRASSVQEVGMLIAAAAEEAAKPGSVDAPIGEKHLP
jgi:hypothetical protein